MVTVSAKDGQLEGDIEIAKAFTPTDKSLKQLRNTVLLRLLIVSLVPMIALSFYFYHQFRATLEQRSKNQLSMIASAHRDAIDNFINQKIVALRSLIESGLVTFPPSKPDMENLHQVLKNLDETILDVGVFDMSGSQLCYSGPFSFLEGKSYQNELWFKTLCNSEESVFISDVYLGYRENPHFIIAERTEINGTSWVVRMTIDPVSFMEMVDDVKQIDGAHAFIVNDQGIFQSVPDEVGLPLGKYTHWDSLQQNFDLFHFAGEDDMHLLSIKRMNSVNWMLILQQPLKKAYKPVTDSQLVVGIIIFIGFISTIAASLLATKTLVRKYSRSEKNRAELIDQLIQAGKMSTMGEMAAGVAHEINNPLAIILSEIGLMEDYLDPSIPGEFDRENFLQRLNSIREEADRSREIIHKLLGFARRTKTNTVKCNINEIIKDTVALIENEFSLDDISINLDLAEDIVSLKTDVAKIKQVLLNLFMNAKDAIGKNGKISVRTLEDRKTVSFIVRDTGCGISKENLQKIFMPFFSTKEVGKGTGLGLSITHGIVTSLGGRIHVTSEKNEGTSFEIVLPKTR